MLVHAHTCQSTRVKSHVRAKRGSGHVGHDRIRLNTSTEEFTVGSRVKDDLQAVTESIAKPLWQDPFWDRRRQCEKIPNAT